MNYEKIYEYKRKLRDEVMSKFPKLSTPTWREYLYQLYFAGTQTGDYSTFVLEQHIPNEIWAKLEGKGNI